MLLVRSRHTGPETSWKICEDLFCFPLLKTAGKLFLKTFFGRSLEKKFWRPFFCFWRSPKTFFEHLLLENTCACVLVLGLEHSCPWPREVCPRKSCTCSWPRIFFVLGLEPCDLESTSGRYEFITMPTKKNVLFHREEITHKNGQTRTKNE